MANLRLELHNGTGALIATNDGWQTTIRGGIITSDQVSVIQNTGSCSDCGKRISDYCKTCNWGTTPPSCAV